MTRSRSRSKGRGGGTAGLKKMWRSKLGIQQRKLQRAHQKAEARLNKRIAAITNPSLKNVQRCWVCCVDFVATVDPHGVSDLHKELVELKKHLLFEAKFHKTLEEQIEQKGGDMPFIGLQYVRQYLPNGKDELTYECTLCQVIQKSRTIMYHVLSVGHRINYLAKHHKSMGIGKNYQISTRDKYMHLINCATSAAKIDGKQEIIMMNRVYVPKPEPVKAEEQKPKKKNVTGNIALEVKERSDLRARARRRELAKAIMASRASASQNDSPANDRPAYVMKLLSTFKDSRPKKEPEAFRADRPTLPKVNPRPLMFIPALKDDLQLNTTGLSESVKPETVVIEVPRESIPDCFWCNEELYDFLGHLTVERPEEVDLVLKVTEMLSNALVRHQDRAESIKRRIEEEKKRLEEEKQQFLTQPGITKVITKFEKYKTKAKIKEEKMSARRKALEEAGPSDKPLFPIGAAPVSTEPPAKAQHLLSQSFDSYRPSAKRSRSPQGRRSSPKNRSSSGRRSPRNRSPARNRSPRRNRSPQRNRSPKRSSTRSPPARSRTSPRRLSNSSSNPAQARPVEAQRNRSQDRGTAEASQQQSIDVKAVIGEALSRLKDRGMGEAGQQRPSGSIDVKAVIGQALNKLQALQSAKNSSQQQIPGSQFSQAGPASGQRAGTGPQSNTNPRQSTSNANLPPQRMQGSRFSQAGPSSGSGLGFGQTGNNPQGSESNFQQHQSRFGPGSDGQDPGMRQPVGGSWPGQSMADQRSASYPSRPGLGDQRPSGNQPRQLSDQRLTGPSFNESRPFWQVPHMEMDKSNVNEPNSMGNRLGQMWQGPKPELRGSMNDTGPISKAAWLGQMMPSKDSYSYSTQMSNQPQSAMNEQRGPANAPRPSYGTANMYPESGAYYKQNERLPGSQYGNGGPTGAASSSFGPGAGRPEEPYYKANAGLSGSQYGSGGPRQPYGPGAGRPDKSVYYNQNAGSQYGNAGSTGGARPYGAAAGRPGGPNDGYGTNYSTSYPLTVTSGAASGAGSQDMQSGQRPAGMGAPYGAGQGNWNRGPGAGSRDMQQPPPSNQGGAPYNASW